TRLLYSPFLFTATAPTAISTLSLHDALPIFALGVASQLGITLDLVLLGGHQQQVHLARFGSLTQHLVVDRHVFDVKRDVLFCLPCDLFAQLGGGHHGDANLADDDALPRHTQGHVPATHLELTHQAAHSIGNEFTLDDLPIHDGAMWERGDA